MSKTTRHKKKAAQRSEARAAKKIAISEGTYVTKIKVKKMVTVYARSTCGCCETSLVFASVERAHAAFVKNAFQSWATITDDTGEAHEDIDTFYGFSLDSEEMESRSLGYLASLISRG